MTKHSMVYGIAGASCSDIAKLKAAGFIDFHLVVRGGAAPTTSASFVTQCNNNGVSPIFNNGNDGISGCAGYDPNWYYSTVAQLGWHAAGGESEPKAEWKAIMANLPGMDYGGEWNGCTDLSNIWAHQMAGENVSGKGMAAYLETYIGVAGVALCPAEVVNAAVACKAHGCKEVGLMIGGWMVNHGYGAQNYINIIDAMEAKGVTCAGVCLWWGYGIDMVTNYNASANVIKGIQAVYPAKMTTLKSRFAGPAPAPGPTPTPTPTQGNPIAKLKLTLVHGSPWFTLNGQAWDVAGGVPWGRMTGLWRYDDHSAKWIGVAWVPVAKDGKFSYVLTNYLQKGTYHIRVQTNDGVIGDITEIEIY